MVILDILYKYWRQPEGRNIARREASNRRENMQFGFKKLQFAKNDLPNHEQKLYTDSNSWSAIHKPDTFFFIFNLL